MVQKLYENNPYMKECTANIIEVINKNDEIHIVLDKTIFFPEGGGQLCDKGYINDIEVLDVYEKDEEVYHVLKSEPKGKEVICKLDWQRRLNHMQQHAGEHILSAAILKLYGGNNKGFHMGDDYVTIDIDLPGITEKMVCSIEEEANKTIYENREIKTYYTSKTEAEKLQLRKEIAVDVDNIRIVEIPEVECVACCGTHPAKTGDIGIIKILKTEKYKGMTRVYFNCGIRALKDFQRKNSILSKISRKYSVDERELAAKLNTDEEKFKNIMQELKDLKKSLYVYEANEILSNERERVIARIFEDKDFEYLQGLANEILKKEDRVVVFGALKDNRIYFAHNGNEAVHCGKIFKEHIKEYNGKGGGSNKFAQGAFNSKEDLKDFVEFISDILK